jgi:hypothetical protein
VAVADVFSSAVFHVLSSAVFPVLSRAVFPVLSSADFAYGGDDNAMDSSVAFGWRNV